MTSPIEQMYAERTFGTPIEQAFGTPIEQTFAEQAFAEQAFAEQAFDAEVDAFGPPI